MIPDAMRKKKYNVKHCSAECLGKIIGHPVAWNGDLELLGTVDADYMTKGVAVVGARNVSETGRRWVRRLVVALVEAGCGVISGCARGVDMEAHREAVKLGAGSATMAVLPAGLGMGFGKELEGAVANGRAVLLSPYPTGHPARRWTFAHRNKLIAQIAVAMLVVEVGVKSGTMQSAREMLRLGKPVFVMAVDPTSPTAEGMVQLVHEGGILVSSVKHVMKYLADAGFEIRRVSCGVTTGKTNHEVVQNVANGSDCVQNGIQAMKQNEQIAYRRDILSGLHGDFRRCMELLIEVGNIDLTSMSVKTGLGTSTLLQILSDLEMRGYIYQKMDIYYVSQN